MVLRLRENKPRAVCYDVKLADASQEGPMDDHDVISQAESDEEILTFDVSDDALERAASPEEKAFTAVYCTRALYFDCGWPTVENG